MASDALSDIERQKKQVVVEQYGGKPANQFVAEMKSSTMFQFSWGELLGAAPTALSLMGSCWIAAADPAADKIILTKAVPTGGFKYIVNRSVPTLRTVLVDVCNNGGRQAFTLAGRNMAALQVRAHSICNERIELVFKRLPAVTKGPDQLQDFNDALEDFAEDARQAAQLATETREAFSLWGKMVGELHAATENQQNQTSIEQAQAQTDETTAEIDKTFAVDAAAAAKTNVDFMKNQLQKAEKRLDSALSNVPGPWATVVQGAVTGFTQAMPALIGGALPMLIAASNPLGGLAAAANAPKPGTKKGTKGAKSTADTSENKVTQAAVQDVKAANAAAKQANDPAYAAAGEIRDLVTHLYEYLGGEKGSIDWTKFENSKENSSQSGCAYLLATFKGRKTHTDVTESEPNKLFFKQLDALIAVVSDISETLVSQTDFKSENTPQEKLDEWKANTRAAQLEVVKLAASAPIQGGNTNAPVGFGKIDVPKPDLSAQTAQLSTAMQGVQIATNAVELAEGNYNASIKKQQETAKEMLEVEKRLKSLQEKGKTLAEIKDVLRSCIAVLVDLVIQIGKLEKFFTMLTTVIDNIVLPTAKRFQRDMTRVGERSARDKYISVDDTMKQTIYISTLQLKAYFSLLEDIAGMYTEVDTKYIAHGMDLCTKLSAGSDSKGPMAALAAELSTYTSDASRDVAAMVNARQQEMLKGLRERATAAAATSQVLEDTVRKTGATLDTSAKQAIDQGKQEAAAVSATLVQGNKSAAELRNEEIEL
ncbi:hypothetical protein DOTSEDRAFT_72478 [Dothistroma septosporum NZE10]|uniref:Uncharacterized protein n=1 Tax=Dothistroma septosporum (strain NZE10 / CBS 128990) TaxID=675120 RepID=M2WM40_DOTSN|nr:hypothetical protein DOTSEDRAFT_72478 [Dothistroma septosporum NZE10]